MTNYWDYEYIPEIADTGVPRELQEKSFAEWKKNPSKESMNKLIRTFGKLINAEVGKYQGTLDREILYNFAKKYVTDAVKSYNPNKANQLSTHIVNQLKRLHRLNYQNVQGLRTPENIQGKFVEYQQARELLENTLGRSPKIDELAKQMNSSVPELKKMKKYMKYEQEAPSLSMSSMYTETSPEETALDLVYHDIPDSYKKILEYRTGYNNAPILSGKQIAKKLNISPARVTQISKSIGDKLVELLYGTNKV